LCYYVIIKKDLVRKFLCEGNLGRPLKELLVRTMTCGKSNIALFLVRRQEKDLAINSSTLSGITRQEDGHENCPPFYAVPVTYGCLSGLIIMECGYSDQVMCYKLESNEHTKAPLAIIRSALDCGHSMQSLTCNERKRKTKKKKRTALAK